VRENCDNLFACCLFYHDKFILFGKLSSGFISITCVSVYGHISMRDGYFDGIF